MRQSAPILCAALLAATSPATAAGLKVAVFPIEPVEMPGTANVRAKLEAGTALIRSILAAKGYDVLDLGPQAKVIAAKSPLSQCNGCDQDIAKALGADLEVATAVQQSSSAIFNLSGSVKDVASNRTLREGVVDIRGDAPEVWAHGIKFLVRERLLDPPLPADATALKETVAKLPN